MRENLTKSSSIKRGMSFATIVLTGDLFQTRFFNDCVDILIKNEVNFRVIEWEIGNTSINQSSVTLQIVAKDH